MDTNILIRAVIRPQGTVGPVLQGLRHRRYHLLYSRTLIDELVEKLTLPRIKVKYQLTTDDVTAILAIIVGLGEEIEAKGNIQVCRDPKDNFLLETALTGKADFLVSGDQDLLVLNPFDQLPIIEPAQFLRELDAFLAQKD